MGSVIVILIGLGIGVGFGLIFSTYLKHMAKKPPEIKNETKIYRYSRLQQILSFLVILLWLMFIFFAFGNAKTYVLIFFVVFQLLSIFLFFSSLNSRIELTEKGKMFVFQNWLKQKTQYKWSDFEKVEISEKKMRILLFPVKKARIAFNPGWLGMKDFTEEVKNHISKKKIIYK